MLYQIQLINMRDHLRLREEKARPSNPTSYRITGRVRDKDNIPAPGCAVWAFDKDPDIFSHSDNLLGVDTTDGGGTFEIVFERTAFEDWFEGSPEVYLVVSNSNGTLLIETFVKENTTKRMDFQIKLESISANPAEPDTYAHNLARMITAFRTLFDPCSLCDSDVGTVVEVLSRAISSWVIYRDELASYAGYDAIQVPSHPRWAEHFHVTRWDKPILPIEGGADQ